MKSNFGIVSLVLVLMAASSLVSMFSVLRIDSIIHRDLYGFGLQFSYQWALPYWTMTTIIFAVGWFNIILSFAFQFYVILYIRKEGTAQETQKKPELMPSIEALWTTQKLDEQHPEKAGALVEEHAEPLLTVEEEPPVENVKATTADEVSQSLTETPVEATNDAAETSPEEQSNEIETENPVEEQQSPESQSTEQQQVTESQEPQPSANEPEQQTTTEKTEDTQPIIEVPVASEEQLPTQTETSDDTNPQQSVGPSQN